MKEKLRIADAITAFLLGKATSEQIKELDAWINTSENNRQLFASLASSENFQKAKKEFRSREIEKAFQKVRTAYHHRHRILSRLSYTTAALILLFIGITILYVPPGTENLPENLYAQTKEFRNKAYLTLSSGEVILLSHRDTIVRTNEKAIAISGTGRISYETNTKPTHYDTLYNQLKTPRGSEYFLILPDSTKVWLNSDSRLRFPTRFDGKKRKVELSGEAYFEVSPDKTKPFIVLTDRSQVKVTGTAFCIRTYPQTPNQTTLVKGVVEVSDFSGKTCTLKPGEQASIENQTFSIQKVETIYYTAWKDGYFMFNQESLYYILDALAQWYDFNYSFTHAELGNIKMSVRVKRYDQIDTVLRLLSKTGKFTFIRDSKSIIITKI